MYAEWRNDPVSFFAWVEGNLPPREEGQTLDRLDVDGHYEPYNLQWATATEQNQNRRSTLAHRATQEALLHFGCLCPSGMCPGEFQCPERLLFLRLKAQLPDDMSGHVAEWSRASVEAERQRAEDEERLFAPFTQAQMERDLDDVEL